MRSAPVGATVALSYDLVHDPDWPDPDEGDWPVSCSVRTQTCVAAYLIMAAGRVRSTASPRRCSLRCLKLEPAAPTRR